MPGPPEQAPGRFARALAERYRVERELGRVFSFDDPDVRIDYPVWSPDGKWVLFDRFRPQGGDIWVIEGVE